MIEQKNITAIGKFQKTHALKGELNAILDIDSSFLLEGNAVIVELDGIFVPFYASGVRPKGNTSYLVKLDGIDSEDEARRFVNKIIYALKSELAPFLEVEEEDIADEDELIGYEIIDYDSNKVIGKIEDIDSSTSNLLFIVVSATGDTIYIPAAEEFIMDINDEDKKIYMRLPEGLIDLN
ncbi:MAG: ribosome maturation factor RimM [Muribaculaceae bacterium]|nr:ribosome maturation factor RimM [Muribaculaceae bacterium]MDE6794600.1 ribosome maturation factor RimM [Muribaculaceae bacterium]